METKAIRKKLISDFGKIIQDDTKLLVLEGVFDTLNNEKASYSILEKHYLKVEESREEYLLNNDTGILWDDFEKQIKLKYNL